MMNLNARLTGLLALAWMFFVVGSSFIISRTSTVSPAVRPAAFFASPVAAGGLLFPCCVEQT